MKSNRYLVKVMCVVVCWSLVMVILILSSPAQATNGCYKYITFKNESAYIANASVRYELDNHEMSQQTGNFPTGQEKRVPLPCNAVNVRATAHAVGGHDIFSMGLGNAQDRCFKLKGTTFNTRHESCDPPGTTQPEVSSCNKYITFKNQSGYVANATVRYYFNNQFSSSPPTGNFPTGQSKRVPVPCEATSVSVNAEAVAGKTIIQDFLFSKAEDRCFAFKGTSMYPHYEFCDPPGTPPLYVIDCWKHITLKNEGAYVVNAQVSYMIEIPGVVREYKSVKTGDFSHGQVKRLPVPCGFSSNLHADAVLGAFNLLDIRNLPANRDYCYIFRGTSIHPRYEVCEAAVAEQKHDITIRNHGAYATELTVHYDYNRERKTAKKVIQTQQHAGLSIPLEAKNVQVTAKAIAGKQIFEKIFPAAESYCREVKGTTLFPKHEPCN
jgi:hypothetical protein